MRLGKKGIYLPPVSVERQRVRVRFGRDHLLPPHRVGIDDIYHPRISDGDVQTFRVWVQKNYVRRSTERNISQHPTCGGVDRQQHAGVTGTQQATLPGIEILAMRTRRRNVVQFRNLRRFTGVDYNDLRRRCDVYEKRVKSRIVNGPARSPTDFDVCDLFLATDVDDGY